MADSLTERAAALEAFADAAALANTCADACLAEAEVATLVDCIALDRLVADACELAGRVLGRRPLVGADRQAVALVLAATEACAVECERHGHAHCGACAAACRRAATAARAWLDPKGGPSGAPLEEPERVPPARPGTFENTTSGR